MGEAHSIRVVVKWTPRICSPGFGRCTNGVKQKQHHQIMIKVIVLHYTSIVRLEHLTEDHRNGVGAGRYHFRDRGNGNGTTKKRKKLKWNMLEKVTRTAVDNVAGAGRVRGDSIRIINIWWQLPGRKMEWAERKKLHWIPIGSQFKFRQQLNSVWSTYQNEVSIQGVFNQVQSSSQKIRYF